MISPGSRLAAVVATVAVTTLAACSGGSPGRDETVVSGNVRSAVPIALASAPPTLWQRVTSWWRAEAVAQAPGIGVSIVGSTVSTTTDEAGFFRIDSRAFGEATLRFAAEGIDASLGVVLPAGGEFELVNVDLEGLRATVEEMRIHFSGPLTAVDCDGGLVQVLSGERVPFRLRIDSQTPFFDSEGRPIACTGLVLGRDADVQAVVNSGNDLRAISLQQGGGGGDGAPTPDVLDFTGAITATDCPAQIAVTRDGQTVVVAIESGTSILESGGAALACAALAAGDLVRVTGSEDAFGVSADSIERLPPPTATPVASPTPTATATP